MAELLSTLFGANMNLPNTPELANPGMGGIQLQGGMGAGGFDSGALGGQMFNNLQDTLARNFRDSDLRNANAEMAYGENVKNVPILDSVRDLAMQGMGLEKEMFNTGLKKEQAVSGAKKDVAENIAKASKAQLEELFNQQQGMHGIAGIIKESPDFLNDPEAQKAVKSIADKASIKGVPSTFTQKDVDHINSWAKAAENSVEFRNKVSVLDTAYKQEVGETNYKAGKGKLELQIAAAQMNLQSQRELTAEMKYMSMPDDAKTLLEVRNKITKGEALDQIDLMRLRSLVGQNPTVANALSAINEKGVMMQLLSMQDKQLIKMALQNKWITPADLSTLGPDPKGKLMGMLVPKIAAQLRDQVIENHVAKLTAGSTIVDAQNKPSHYEQQEGEDYKLVPGPSINGTVPPEKPAVTQSGAAVIKDDFGVTFGKRKISPGIWAKLPDGTLMPKEKYDELVKQQNQKDIPGPMSTSPIQRPPPIQQAPNFPGP